MKYIWMVLEQGAIEVKVSEKPVKIVLMPDVNLGIVNTFAEAAAALSAWHGAEDDPPHRLYQIVPMLGEGE